MRPSVVALGVGMWLALAGCAPPAVMQVPAPFVRYAERGAFKLITAEGVRVKIREAKNYPRAGLSFWKDAAHHHLKAKGYVLESAKCFDTVSGQRGCTATFVVSRGQSDWVFQQTLFVDGRRLVIVEAVGPYAAFTKVASALAGALRTVRW